MTHMAAADFLDHFNHSFLIRGPAKTPPSMYDKWLDCRQSRRGRRLNPEARIAEQAENFGKTTVWSIGFSPRLSMSSLWQARVNVGLSDAANPSRQPLTKAPNDDDRESDDVSRPGDA